jgi:hypothetical protein
MSNYVRTLNRLKPLSTFGTVLGVTGFWVATLLYPGGYDWNQDYISTLIRGPATPARIVASAGLLVFCASIALVFERLARVFAKHTKLIRIGGIGSMVYAAFTLTPMHDLMVMIALIFFLLAAMAILHALYHSRAVGFFVAGCLCLAVLVASAAIYYTGYYTSALPWAQRVSFALFAIWLVALDHRRRDKQQLSHQLQSMFLNHIEQL